MCVQKIYRGKDENLITIKQYGRVTIESNQKNCIGGLWEGVIRERTVGFNENFLNEIIERPFHTKETDGQRQRSEKSIC